MKTSQIKALLGSQAFNVLEINTTSITLLDESKEDGRLTIETTKVKLYTKCSRFYSKKKRPRISKHLTNLSKFNKNINKAIKEFKQFKNK